MAECVFCNIVEGKLPAKQIYEDEEKMAFLDINPQAPVHILIVPKAHIAGMNDIEEKHQGLLGRTLLLVKKLAADHNLEAGYRTVINCGRQAGQEVFHLHVHLLGGRLFTWPPG